MAASYYLSDGANKLGPFTERQVLESIASGKVGLFDLIFNQQINDWVMILQHPDFADIGSGGSGKSKVTKKSNPDDHKAVGLLQEDFSEQSSKVVTFMKDIVKAAYDHSQVTSAASSETPSILPTDWYLKEGSLGPFSYLEIIRLVSERKVNEQSLIGQSVKGPWKKLADFEQFSAAALAQFRFTNAENLPDVHIRRKSVRKVCGKSYIVFANNSAFKVYCVDISDTGCGVLMRSPRVKKGDEVYLKFSESLESNKFDVKARVLSDRKVRLPGDEHMYMRFGLVFESFSEAGRQYLVDFLKNATKDAV